MAKGSSEKARKHKTRTDDGAADKQSSAAPTGPPGTDPWIPFQLKLVDLLVPVALAATWIDALKKTVAIGVMVGVMLLWYVVRNWSSICAKIRRNTHLVDWPLLIVFMLTTANIAYVFWSDRNTRGAETAQRDAEMARRVALNTISARSLKELRELDAANRSRLETSAARDYLFVALSDNTRSYVQRGNAAICLVRNGSHQDACAALRRAFSHSGDPSLASWTLGAARDWVGERCLPALLELAELKSTAWCSADAQVRNGAIAALGIAGVDKFTEDPTRKKITEALLRLYTKGKDAPLDSLVGWSLRRLGSSPGSAGPIQEVPAFGWYRNPAGQTMIHLKDVKLERPLVTQSLDPYYLGDTEVTVKLFERFVNDTKYVTHAERVGSSSGLEFNNAWKQVRGANWKNLGRPRESKAADSVELPVVHVSWIDAAHFCNWCSAQERLPPYYEIENDRVRPAVGGQFGYRLPTRAELTCAALADTRTSFWWGRYDFLNESDWRKDPDWAAMVANLPDQSVQSMDIRDTIAATDDFTYAAPVGTFRPNPLGFFDIIGNVAEWCDWDRWDADKLAGGNKPRVGGAWCDELRRCSWREERDDEINSHHLNVGFRIARSVSDRLRDQAMIRVDARQ